MEKGQLSFTINQFAMKVHYKLVNPEVVHLALLSTTLSEAETCADNPKVYNIVI